MSLDDEFLNEEGDKFVDIQEQDTTSKYHPTLLHTKQSSTLQKELDLIQLNKIINGITQLDITPTPNLSNTSIKDISTLSVNYNTSNLSDIPTKEKESKPPIVNTSSDSLNKELKKVSFSQELNVGSFSKHDPPSNQSIHSKSTLVHSPKIKTKSIKQPFILNPSENDIDNIDENVSEEDGVYSSDGRDDEESDNYSSSNGHHSDSNSHSDSDSDNEMYDNQAVMQNVKESKCTQPSMRQMEDYIQVKQCQSQFFEKRDLLMRTREEGKDVFVCSVEEDEMIDASVVEYFKMMKDKDVDVDENGVENSVGDELKKVSEKRTSEEDVSGRKVSRFKAMRMQNR